MGSRSPGPVERAIRSNLVSGTTLSTPAQGKPFTVSRIDDHGVVLLLGERQTATPLSWTCLEGVVRFLAGRGWVEIGSRYDVSSSPDTLDGYLKGCINRATAGWVAAVLEQAAVVEIDRSRPAAVRLLAGSASQRTGDDIS